MSSNLVSNFWYHGPISRDKAEALLEVDGDFLIRASLKNGQEQFVVSCKTEASFLHIVILLSQGKYMIDEDIEKFLNIEDLVNVYTKKAYPVSKLSNATMKRPISNLKRSTPTRPARLPSLKSSTPLDLKVLETIKSNLIEMDAFKIAKHIVQVEIDSFSTLDVNILLPLENAKAERAKEIRRTKAFRHLIQALLLIGELTSSCLLLEKLISSCAELLQTLKCHSALTTIMRALISDPVARHSKLWEMLKKDHIVTALTYERLLLPTLVTGGSIITTSFSLTYLSDLFEVIDDVEVLEKLNTAQLIALVNDGRLYYKDSANQLDQCRSRLGDFPTNKILSEILTTKYQEKVLFGRIGASPSQFATIEELIATKAKY